MKKVILSPTIVATLLACGFVRYLNLKGLE